MDGITETTGPGFWQTHPAPSDRVQWVLSEIESSSLTSPTAEEIAVRAARFTERYTNAETTQPASRGGETTDRSGRSGTETGGRSDTGSGASSGGRQ